MNGAELAERLGLHRVAAATWRGACPACGYGSDAFLLTCKGGSSPRGWCASCQDGDAVWLALSSVRAGKSARVSSAVVPPERVMDETARTEAALTVWHGATAALGTPADAYLSRRGLPALAASQSLRWRPDVRHPSGGGGRHAAMIALVVDVANRPMAVHRTYLTNDGFKAQLTPVKASKGPIAGGAIRLDPVAPHLVIGEGIETAASAGVLLGLAAWSAISAGNLARSLELPAEVHSVTIAADPDPPGRAAAEQARDRWRAEGRRVRIARPPYPQDANDVLMERLASA